MFVICPKCSAEYRIPADKHLEKGQLLKCSACHHLFKCPVASDVSETEKTVPEMPLPETPVLTETPGLTQDSAPFPNGAFKMSLYEQPIKEKLDTPAFFADERIKMAANEHDELLPEEFMPLVAPEKNNKRHWVPLYIAFYLVVIAAAGWLGWHYRFVLKPHFYDLSILFDEKSRARPVIKITVPTPNVQSSSTRDSDSTLEVVSKTNTIPNVEQVSDSKPLPEVKVATGTEPIFDVEKAGPDEPRKNIKGGEDKASFIPPTPVESVVSVTAQPSATATTPPQVEDMSPREEISVENAVEQSLDKSIQDESSLFTILPLTYRIEQQVGQASQLLIEGSVKNSSFEEQPSPMVQVRVYDKTGHVVASKKVHLTDTVLPPEGIGAFFTGITPAPTEVERVEATVE